MRVLIFLSKVFNVRMEGVEGCLLGVKGNMCGILVLG